MPEDIKHKLDPMLEVAILYLQNHCSKNNTSLYLKYIKVSSGKIMAICTSDNNTYASVGLDQNGTLKVFMQDPKIYKWAKLEGFSESDMYEKLEDELIQEVSIIDLATALVK